MRPLFTGCDHRLRDRQVLDSIWVLGEDILLVCGVGAVVDWIAVSIPRT